MPEYVRVRDKDTGHELSVIKSTVPRGNYDVLDEPATRRNGEVLPPKHGKPVTPTTKKPGQQADTKKESDD